MVRLTSIRTLAGPSGTRFWSSGFFAGTARAPTPTPPRKGRTMLLANPALALDLSPNRRFAARRGTSKASFASSPSVSVREKGAGDEGQNAVKSIRQPGQEPVSPYAVGDARGECKPTQWGDARGECNPPLRRVEGGEKFPHTERVEQNSPCMRGCVWLRAAEALRSRRPVRSLIPPESILTAATIAARPLAGDPGCFSRFR